MSETIDAKGRCMCGEVEIHAFAITPSVGACHCSMCRKWSGGPLLTIDCNASVKLTGEKSIVSYASSDWAERGFCVKCGTHLFYKLKNHEKYFIPVGLFDVSSTVNFDHQIFIEEKPEYYAFANETKNFTGEEVFAQFTGD